MLQGDCTPPPKGSWASELKLDLDRRQCALLVQDRLFVWDTADLDYSNYTVGGGDMLIQHIHVQVHCTVLCLALPSSWPVWRFVY